MSRRRRNTAGPRLSMPPPIELNWEELGAILERAKAALTAEDHTTLKAAMDTLAFVTAELQAKGVSLDRLRRLLFGAKTETTRTILGSGAAPSAPGAARSPEGAADPSDADAPRRGHGRHRAAAYTGADLVQVGHPSLHRGDGCPECIKGKVYPLAEPAMLVRITGMAPLGATVYERDRLRCNLCGEIFTAPAPEGVGEAK